MPPITRAQQRYNARYFHRLRMEALLALGGECVVCGYDDDRALHIDHVNGGGKAERKKLGAGKFYRKVEAEAGSGEYQLLCANCHLLKSHANGEHGRPRRKLA